MKDIVARLRAMTGARIFLDAADEIERLRAENGRLRGLLVGAEIAMNRDENVEAARRLVMEGRRT